MNGSIYVAAVNEWNRLPNSLLFAVLKIFGINKFRRFFSISSLSSINILAVYM